MRWGGERTCSEELVQVPTEGSAVPPAGSISAPASPGRGHKWRLEGQAGGPSPAIRRAFLGPPRRTL